MSFREWVIRVLAIAFFIVAVCVGLLGGMKHQVQDKVVEAAPRQAPIWSQFPQMQLQSWKNKLTESSNVLQPYINSNNNALAQYRPNYEISWADPSNYGERYSKDITGNPVRNQPIVVLHETTFSASSALNSFQTHHEKNNDQASYHSLIKLDGTVIYIVPPEKRAFGAGNSIFDSLNGSETVKTNINLPSSVNNFAYHVSLETPPDGWGDKQINHSPYTEAQYNSLAWLIAQCNVPDQRITTHRAVDRSGQRIDPTNFDFNKFLKLLHYYRQLG